MNSRGNMIDITQTELLVAYTLPGRSTVGCWTFARSGTNRHAESVVTESQVIGIL